MKIPYSLLWNSPFERLPVSRRHCLGHVISRVLGKKAWQLVESFAFSLEVDTSPIDSSHIQSDRKHVELVRQIRTPNIRRKMLRTFGKTVQPNPLNCFDFETETEKKFYFSCNTKIHLIWYGTSPIWIINNEAQINPTPTEITLMITAWNASEYLLNHLEKEKISYFI